ncbi:multidrug efflux MFS transporter periplasmic adaptor subunit EmrA [Escherichia coli]
MSANAETQTPQQPVKKSGKRKRLLLLLTLLFIIIAVAIGIYWFLVLRHFEETDDAYVAGNQIQIMSQVSGSVTKVWADNTDFVKAKTALASSVRQTHQLMINSKQLQANIEVQKIALAKAQSDYNRRVPLGNANLIGREELQHARDAVTSAQAQLDVAIQQYNANQAMILGTKLEDQPAVQQAATEVRNAWLALERTRIVSPMTGYVSRRAVQPGAQISPTTPLMAVVPATNMWVDANFKETQIANMRIGQPVTITTDIYGDDVKYTGKVVGLDMGTGSAFSLLPAQNATGNWIKVVQRLPVRIELDQKQLEQYPLRIGLSTLVSVNTTNRDGQVLANKVRSTPVAVSTAREISLAPVNKLIDDIVKANAG